MRLGPDPTASSLEMVHGFGWIIEFLRLLAGHDTYCNHTSNQQIAFRNRTLALGAVVDLATLGANLNSEFLPDLRSINQIKNRRVAQSTQPPKIPGPAACAERLNNFFNGEGLKSPIGTCPTTSHAMHWRTRGARLLCRCAAVAHVEIPSHVSFLDEQREVALFLRPLGGFNQPILVRTTSSEPEA